MSTTVFSHTPLAGAAVSLVTTDSRLSYGAVSDSAGHYTFPEVAPGEYLIGFFHPVPLDSIGIESPVHRLTIDPRDRLPFRRVNLAVPGARSDSRRGVAGLTAANDTAGIFVGHVQDATTRALVTGAVVTAEWLVLGVAKGRLIATTPAASVKSGTNGWFAFCGLPADAPISFVASLQGDSSGTVSLSVPAHRAVHHDLVIGPPERVTRGPVDTVGTPDSLRVPPAILYRGAARLSGIVRDALSHAPLPDVQVTVVGTGLTTMASVERGEFFCSRSFPLGTQTLAARVEGYLPTELLVDLFARDTARVDFQLPTLKSVLDTVKVTASRIYSADRNGFSRRQKTGFGHYFDAEQIAKINPIETSNMVTRIPGCAPRRPDWIGSDSPCARQRAPGVCTPDIYIDGFLQQHMKASTSST